MRCKKILYIKGLFLLLNFYYGEKNKNQSLLSMLEPEE
jgi:hypothetical protein